jgi:hypothetical protein
LIECCELGRKVTRRKRAARSHETGGALSKRKKHERHSREPIVRGEARVNVSTVELCVGGTEATTPPSGNPPRKLEADQGVFHESRQMIR